MDAEEDVSLQVKHEVAKLKNVGTYEQGELHIDSNQVRTNHEIQLLQKSQPSIESHYAEFWWPPSHSPLKTQGLRKTNCGEFVRMFRHQYEEVVGCEATLIEILADDHLAGRAKNIFMALPRTISVQGDQVRNAQIFATGTVLVKNDLGTSQKLKESLERILNDDRFGRLPNLDPYRRQLSFVKYFLLDKVHVIDQGEDEERSNDI
ncbi:unnamed protein product [Nippostrongylus brasiliensis]|uniref:Glucuronosyltransferase n=1 Tax=Nippostrongylus brasiliensis TaxID=27835 RepID=A0A0N4YUA4_NIPBR|nr:unnamed protein product [Nippostrongylus brasiliensis]